MTKRQIDITAYGFTEETWAALSEDRKLHFRNRDTYQRHREWFKTRQLEYYYRTKKLKEQSNDGRAD